ncbi:recombinase family protein [Mycobacterium asiaticum]|uniref:recombinase family protein n=1 Tax=Mycobacterium asiaticum TaxID=1790 RepID=UPI0009BD3D70|nr:recombinase family protein [Mycobacterium asiaticum]
MRSEPKPPSPIKAGIYCRISEDKTGLRAGVERQEADCRELAARLGWHVVRVYTDNDISAFSGKHRPQYADLCADIERGAVKAVVAWHPDRLHRSPKELEAYIDLCRDGEVANATCQAGLWDLSTPSGRMTARTLGNVARYESEHKSERIRRQKQEAARAGEHNGGIRCFGYEQDGLTIRESEAAEVKRLAHAVVCGESLRSLALDLNRRGVPTVKGGRWTSAHLRSILLRPRLIGMRSHHGEVIAKGQWPAILDEATWEAVRLVLEDPKRRSGGSGRRGRTPTCLGTGLYICGVCGERRIRLGRSSSRQPVYKCGNVATNGLGHVTRTADALDEFVTDAVIARLSQPGFIAAMVDACAASDSEQTKALVARRETIRAQLGELNEAAEGLSGPGVAAILTRIAREAAELREAADYISAQLAQAGKRSPLEELIDAQNIHTAWHALPLATRRAILADVVDVTILPARPGRRAGGSYFDEDAVALDFKG